MWKDETAGFNLGCCGYFRHMLGHLIKNTRDTRVFLDL